MSVMVDLADDIPVVTFRKADHVAKSRKVPHITSGYSYIDWSKSMSDSNGSSFILSISAKWFALIVLSLLVGYLTTVVDLSSVWMNDLKKGFCFSKLDKWSLLDPYSTCPTEDWHSWSQIIFGFTGFTSNFFVNFPIYAIFAIVFTLGACYVTLQVPEIVYLGIPEIKLIISGLDHNISTYLGLSTLLYKSMGLVLVVSSGFWLGKEGPLVHLSCCVLNLVFNIVYRELGDPFLRRELLSAATATGISVAFNSPIGGVLFTLELLQSYFIPTKIMWNSFISATIAVVVLTGFKIFTNGADFVEKDLFQVEFGNVSWLFVEFIPFAILGVMGGLYGYLFSKLNNLYSRAGWRLNVQQFCCKICKLPLDSQYGKSLEVLVVLVATMLLNFPFEITRLPLEAYVKILFTDCPEDDAMSDLASGGGIGFVCNASNFSNSIKLIYVLIQGFLLASYTFGLHLPGGVLMPSLALGATAGRVIGIISQSIQNGLGWGFSEECTKSSCLVSPSSYAVVGAASFMSGITKLTMCVVVIIFEQTGAISYVLPIMIAVMILKLVNDWLCNDNIYDQWLKREFNKYAKMNVVEDADIPVTNSGKGSGLCSYINATSVVKNNLPDITTLRIMVPLSQIKCIEIVKLLYTISKVREEFIRGNNHEGFPVIGSYQNPVVFGYITKQSLDNAISNYSEEQEFTFALSGGKVLPRSVISDQLRLQQDTQQVRIDDVIVSIDVEMSPIVLNEKTPIVTLLEMFEKLHLNYGIILRCIQKKDQNESIDQLMSGFIDRYLLADLINNNFTSLKDEYVIGSEYDIESMMDSDRQSAELLT